MLERIPSSFLIKMETLLQAEYSEFIHTYHDVAQKGLRVNTLKISIEQFLDLAPFQLEPIPWVKEGFYYHEPDRPGKHPYHACGLYYIQEPSAMAVVEILDPKPGERILDLAAAPGGKATQCAIKMENQGLLIANEIHPVRAKSLSENIERMGISCAIVTNENPQKLAQRFPEFFDRIILDAPCSGEGMFRKDETAYTEWSLDHVTYCAERQISILEYAAQMLRPGGKLVYSTCTFSPEENEQVIDHFLSHHPDWKLLPISYYDGFQPGRPEWSTHQREELKDTVRLWPHRVKGEGHYIALLQKGEENTDLGGEKNRRQKRKNTALAEAVSLYNEFVQEWIPNSALGWISMENFLLFGTQLYSLPTQSIDLDGLKVLRPGLHIGEVKRNRFEPAHAFAIALPGEAFRNQLRLRADEIATLTYLRGEELQIDSEIKGWAGVLIDGYPVGWGKATQGRLKNHYPKGLRVQGYL